MTHQRNHAEPQVEIAEDKIVQVPGNFIDIAVINKLSGTEWALWMYLCRICPFGDLTSDGEKKYKRLPSPAELAIVLGRSEKQIARSAAVIEELGLYSFRTTEWYGYNETAVQAKAILSKLKSNSNATGTKKSKSGQKSLNLDKNVQDETKMSSAGQKSPNENSKPLSSLGLSDSQTKSDLNQKETNNSDAVTLLNRSSHSGEEAPLRVASPSAPCAKTSQRESGASLVSKDPDPDLTHRISTNKDGASRFVQETPPEVEDSAAPHVTPRQNDTQPHKDALQATLPPQQTNPANGQATYPRGAYSAESNRIIAAFLERLPFQYQEQAEDFFRNPQAIALFEQNLTCDVENALKVVTRYIEKKSVDNLGGLIAKAIAQGWKPRPAQPAQPPAPSNNPLDGIPPVDAATLAALEAANLDPDLHQMCLNRFPSQYPGVRMKTIENAAYTQMIRNERKQKQ